MHKYQEYREEMQNRGKRSYKKEMLLRAKELAISAGGALVFVVVLYSYMLAFAD